MKDYYKLMLDNYLLDVDKIAIALQGVPVDDEWEKLSKDELGKMLESVKNNMVKITIKEMERK